MDLQNSILDQTKLILKEDQFIVDVIIKRTSKGKKATVILDADNGISIDDCAVVCRSIRGKMEEEGWDDNLDLEVSSPGLDKPLKLIRQYKKNIGREIKIVLQNNKTEQGKLVQINDQNIQIEKSKNKKITEMQIPLVEIDKVFVLISF